MTRRTKLSMLPLEDRSMMSGSHFEPPTGQVPAAPPAQNAVPNDELGLFRWEMTDRFTDAAGMRGLRDLHYDEAFIQETEFQVKFFVGTQATTTEARDTVWTFRNANTDVALPRRTGASVTVTMTEGVWYVGYKTPRMAVEQVQAIQVRDLLWVTLGDSYGAGEGAPDRPDRLNPTWSDVVASDLPGGQYSLANVAKAHRSTNAASAVAAAKLEDDDKQSSVTFLHLAVSGAEVDDGILTADRRWPDDSDGPGTPTDDRDDGKRTKGQSQLAAMTQLVGDRYIDSLFLSGGGNDLLFGPIVKQIMTMNGIVDPERTYLDHFENLFEKNDAETPYTTDEDPASDNPDDNLLAVLRENYRLLDIELDKIKAKNGIGEIFISTYPDPTVVGPGNKLAHVALNDLLPGLEGDPVEIGWVQSYMIKELNGTVRTAAEKYGWTLIENEGAFKTNGFGTPDTRVNTFTVARANQGSPEEHIYWNEGRNNGAVIGGVVGAAAGAAGPLGFGVGAAAGAAVGAAMGSSFGGGVGGVILGTAIGTAFGGTIGSVVGFLGPVVGGTTGALLGGELGNEFFLKTKTNGTMHPNALGYKDMAAGITAAVGSAQDILAKRSEFTVDRFPTRLAVAPRVGVSPEHALTLRADAVDSRFLEIVENGKVVKVWTMPTAGILDVNAGTANLTVESLRQQHTLTIQKADHVTIGTGTLTAILGNITILKSNSLSVDGSDLTTSKTVAVTGTEITGLTTGRLLRGTTTTGFTPYAHVMLGSGNDAVTFQHNLSRVHIDAGSGTDTMIGTVAGSWTIDATGGGESGSTTFSDVEHLIGSAGNDTFAFSGFGAITGKIAGNGGVDSLDYTNWSGKKTITGSGRSATFSAPLTNAPAHPSTVNKNVGVNLRLGTASATEGISGIRNVTGGSGNDVIVGDAFANRIYGGLGTDLLIGGAGSDTVHGGGGNDILVAASTTMDDDMSALFDLLGVHVGTGNGRTALNGKIIEDGDIDLVYGTNTSIFVGTTTGRAADRFSTIV